MQNAPRHGFILGCLLAAVAMSASAQAPQAVQDTAGRDGQRLPESPRAIDARRQPRRTRDPRRRQP